jgi:nucleoside-diphosphate-sugar epimerase
MNILIVGGNSSLGRALIPVLNKLGKVLTAGRINCDIYIDLATERPIVLPNNIDVIIHTAAHFGGASFEDIFEAENVNVRGTLKLCETAVRGNVKHFIFISSIYAGLEEDSRWQNIYSITKRHAEEMARFCCSMHKLPLTILRPGPIYGNEEHFRRHQPFLYTLIDKSEKGEDIVLYGSKDPYRNYIHIEDVVIIISKVIEKQIEGTYSCTYPEDVTYSQISGIAYKAFNKEGNIVFLKEMPDIPDNIFEKNALLYKIIDFYPQISIEEGISKISNYRKNK